MNFSTDYSCFKTPQKGYTLQTRPNPYRKKGKKRKLDDLDDEGDDDYDNDDDDDVDDDNDNYGNDTGLGSDQQVVSEASPFAAGAETEAVAAVARHYTPPYTSEANDSANTNDGNNNNNGDSNGREYDTDAEVYPTKPISRRLMRHHRYGRNIQTLENHGLFLPPRKQESLRARHLAILSAILHKSVMTRDWARAKRAFAMLIRSDHIDLRKIWPLGSDILLMCPPAPEQTSQRDGDTNTNIDTVAQQSLPLPQVETNTTQSKIKNIEYLQGLIRQFPFLGASANQSIRQSTDTNFATFAAEQTGSEPMPTLLNGRTGMQYANSATFQPFLIAALIAASESTNMPSSLRHGDYGDNGSAKNGNIYQNDHGNYKYQNIIQGDGDGERGLTPSAQTQTQAQAHPMKIKALLDNELINSLPWADDPRIWCIRGMVCLWLADLQEPLLIGETTSYGEHKGDPDSTFNIGLDDDDDGCITPDSLISDNEDDEAAERRKRKQELRVGQSRYALLHESKLSLGNVVKKGGSVPDLLGRAVQMLQKMDHDK